MSRIGPCPAPAVGLALVQGQRSPDFYVGGFANVLTRQKVNLSYYWDLASLTKIMLTVPLALALVRDGLLELDSTLGEKWPLAVNTPYASIAVWELLAHASGAPADMDLREGLGSSSRDLYSLVLGKVSVAEKPLYSDLGYILVGGLIEHVTEKTLAQHVAEIDYLELAPPPEASVATEDCPWRRRLMCGEPHDEKAYVFPDRVAGHAGAFASLPQVARFVQSLLVAKGVERLLLDVASRQWTPPGANRFGLGYRLAGGNGFGGTLRGQAGYGATGFVGNQLWIEPDRGYAVVLLSNRVHPKRSSRELHDEWCSRLLDSVALRLGESAERL